MRSGKPNQMSDARYQVSDVDDAQPKIRKTNQAQGADRTSSDPRSLIPDTGTFDDLVILARTLTPDPIPNSAVKTLSANGTVS